MVVTPQCKDFFRLGRVLRTTLPTGKGGVVHLFVIYGYQGGGGGCRSASLQAVLAEAQVVRVVSLCLLLVTSSPVLLRVFLLVGMLIWLLRILWGLVLLLTLLVDLVGRRALVLVGISLSAVPMLLLRPRLFLLRMGGSLLIFRFSVHAWMVDVACPVACQPVWLACWLDTPERSSSSSTRVVQDVWDVCREELGVVPEEVVLALWDAASRSSFDDFWSIWSRSAELGLFRAYSGARGPTEAGSADFLGRGLSRIRNRRLGARAVGSRGSRRSNRASQGDEVDVHCALCSVLC